MNDERLPLHGRLHQVSRLATIGEMAAGVAHELNQPLTAITTYAQACSRLLDRSEPNLDDVREALKQIASQAVRAGSIIHRLRHLVRHTDADHRPTRLNDLVIELKDLMETDARVQGVKLQLELADRLPPVTVDGIQIQHVLLNLLRNAFEAMDEMPPADRNVSIGTRQISGGVELSVCDSGPGVSGDVADRLFEPFFTTKAAGTGLGLSISATIVRAHDGKLGFRSVPPHGACFYIELPTA